LRQLSTHYPQLKVIKLEQNYRSSTRILKAANTLIANNPKLFEKRLWSDRGHGDAIQITAARDAEHEAELIVMKLIAHKFEHRGQARDYAILYRSNHQARVFEQQLRNHKIPYLLSGGQSFFERSEIKDLIAYLRVLANSDDDPAFIRAITTPRRGVGSQTLEALGRYAGMRQISLFAALFESGAEQYIAAKQLAGLHEFGHFINRLEWRAQREPAGPVMEDLLRAIQYEAFLFDTLDSREAEDKWQNVRDFVDWLTRKGEADGKTLVDLAQTIALITLLDKADEQPDCVQLATLHAAKGLEFKHVFLVGIEEGILPHRESVDSDKIDEERRLMYVGLTRAQYSLQVSYCERRKQGKEWRSCEPSRFINEISAMGDEDIRWTNTQSATPDRATGAARLAQLKEMLASKPPTLASDPS
jgi:ATP-dependent DNA helicase Rep